MKQIRNKVFETNSSSTHSISFSARDTLEDNTMPIDEYDGYIHATFGEFGWEIESYYDQESKLSYLLTMAAHLNGFYFWCVNESEFEEDLKKFIETEDFKTLSDEIASYANCNGVWIDYGEGYVDHQSVYADH